MLLALLRTLSFVRFILVEYVRSGRILIELGVAGAFFAVFLRAGTIGIDPEKFFSVSGIFMLLLTIYTMSAVLGLGDRPQGYVVLVRHVGRAGYLMGLYISGLVILTLIYGLLSLVTAAISHFVDLTLSGWLLGTLPLLLNLALLGSLILMLSPLVFSTGWRLFVLGLIALAFSKSFLGNATLESLWPVVKEVLDSLQTILSWPMVPAFSGFALSLSRDYSGNAPAILTAQCSLLVVLLGLSVYSFSNRELILNTD